MHRDAVGWYSSADVCVIVGCSYRQLDTWARSGLVRPSLSEATGYGSRRRWSADDVAAVRRVAVAAELAGGTIVDVLDWLDAAGVAV
jgi:DNA-binding transcriptional MerR regulator